MNRQILSNQDALWWRISAALVLVALRLQGRDCPLMHMTARPHRPTWLIFDIDSTVLVVYDNQERARVGYNPIKPSYHPLLRFEGRTKDFWHGELRPSDAHTASGPRDLLRENSGGEPVGDCPRGQRVLRP